MTQSNRFELFIRWERVYWSSSVTKVRAIVRVLIMPTFFFFILSEVYSYFFSLFLLPLEKKINRNCPIVNNELFAIVDH